MLQTASTLAVDLTTGELNQSDPISARSSVAITLTGVGSLSAANMKAALYRLNRNGIDGTLVATCNTFVLSSSTFIGTMSLNTAEVIAAFTALEQVREYEKAVFTLLVYDASQAVYMVYDTIDVSYEFPLASGTPPAVTPITSSTTQWGNFRLINGIISIQSVDDGEYYPLTVGGSDATVHGVIGESGVL